jgi:hypothetical protein
MSQIAPALLPALTRIISMPEATYNVLPSSGTANYRALVPPFAFGPIDGMVDVQEVGDARVNSRDPALIGQNLLAPVGQLPVLMDLENIDWWLRLAFGTPAQAVGSGPTAGMTINSYQSGVALGSESLQYGLGDETRRATGVSLDSISIPLGKVDGVRQINGSAIAAQVVRNPSAWTPAATPAARKAPAYVPGWSSSVLVNGSAFAIESGDLTFANNIIREQETNGSRFTSGARGGITACSGTLNLIFRNAAQLASFQGSAASVPLSFVFGLGGSDVRRLKIDLPRAFVEVPELEITDGPIAVSCPFMAKSPLTGSVGMVAVELIHTTDA